jgi:hypothetical protein
LKHLYYTTEDLIEIGNNISSENIMVIPRAHIIGWGGNPYRETDIPLTTKYDIHTTIDPIPVEEVQETYSTELLKLFYDKSQKYLVLLRLGLETVRFNTDSYMEYVAPYLFKTEYELTNNVKEPLEIEMKEVFNDKPHINFNLSKIVKSNPNPLTLYELNFLVKTAISEINKINSLANQRHNYDLANSIVRSISNIYSNKYGNRNRKEYVDYWINKINRGRRMISYETLLKSFPDYPEITDRWKHLSPEYGFFTESLVYLKPYGSNL